VRAQQLTISLTYGSAPIGRPARLQVSLYFSGLLLGEKLEASGTVAQPGEMVRDFAVTALQMSQLHRLATLAGFPDRIPAVQPRNDTSDRWAQVLLYVAIDGNSRTLDLSLMSSGYDGADSSGLKAFLAALLLAAGPKGAPILQDLAGA
jgi:hypothetical protein